MAAGTKWRQIIVVALTTLGSMAAALPRAILMGPFLAVLLMAGVGLRQTTVTALPALTTGLKNIDSNWGSNGNKWNKYMLLLNSLHYKPVD